MRRKYIPSSLHIISASQFAPMLAETQDEKISGLTKNIDGERKYGHTFTGWKKSSITSCALKSSDDAEAPEDSAAAACTLTPELLALAGCRFGCLLCGAFGNIFQVKIIATASPARAPTENRS